MAVAERLPDALRLGTSSWSFPGWAGIVYDRPASERQLELLQPHRQPALVVRWMLHAGLKYEVAKDRYEPFDRIVDEDADSRERIAVAALDALIAERPAFVVVNNKAEGSSPLSVFKLAERIAGWDPAHSGEAPESGDAGAGPDEER